MGVIVRNSVEMDNVAPITPTHPDGKDYLYEVISDGGSIRYYDDTMEGILAFLIPGYDLLENEEEKLTARIVHAIQMRKQVQATVNVELPDEKTTSDERDALYSDLAVPPAPEEWNSSTPLVLMDAFYVPYSHVSAPVSAIADVVNPPNIWWLRPAESEYDYVRSLHAAYVLEVSVTNEEVAV